MTEIYIKELGKYVTREEAIEFFERKRKERDDKYMHLTRVLEELLAELKEIKQEVKKLGGGSVSRYENKAAGSEGGTEKA